MSIKSTQVINREQAISILMAEVPTLSNGALAMLMDTLANTNESRFVSLFDNFTVSNYVSDGTL